uniref:Uncharacterized protein n=1 Tax=Anguilla anguilla TaxID=7936 RepID=A0A0E9W210_ANGAN
MLSSDSSDSSFFSSFFSSSAAGIKRQMFQWAILHF